MNAIEALKNGANWNEKVYGGKIKTVYLNGNKYVVTNFEIEEIEVLNKALKAEKLATAAKNSKNNAIKEFSFYGKKICAIFGWDEFVNPTAAEKTAVFDKLSFCIADKNEVEAGKDQLGNKIYKNYSFVQVLFNGKFVHAFVISCSVDESEWRKEWRSDDAEEAGMAAEQFGVKLAIASDKKKLNRSDIFNTAHKIAKQTCTNLNSYKNAFAAALKKVYAEAKKS